MFTLISLSYAPDALEPVISAQTLAFHHGKHLQGYVNNLNSLVQGTKYEEICKAQETEELALMELIWQADPEGGEAPNAAVFNNAGQVLNHELYFTQFRAPSQAGPMGPLAERIVLQWGSVEAFQKEFEAKGSSLFGSGWVWLSATPDGELLITQEPGAHNPVEKGLKPLLTFDVWEHAYYLDYQNRRPDHLHALWSIVNWSEIERRYAL
jgi:Fe-Mn family superoxide dismutase